MAQLVVRSLDEDIKRRLKERASRHGRSLEAEVREILTAAVNGERPKSGRKSGKRLGTQIAARFKEIGLTEEDWKVFEDAVEEARRGWRPERVEFEK